MSRPQTHFRFTSEPDPNWCASVVNHRKRRARPAVIVTIDGKKPFRLCESCAWPYEGMRNTTVTRIQEVA